MLAVPLRLVCIVVIVVGCTVGCTDREPVSSVAPVAPTLPHAIPRPAPGDDGCPPGEFFVHGGCHTGDSVGERPPSSTSPPGPARDAWDGPPTGEGRCAAGEFFVHGGCHTGDSVGIAGPKARSPDAVTPMPAAP